MALLLQLTQKLAHGFMASWARWPRKQAKKDAEKAWRQKVTSDEIDAKIQQALDWQVPMLEQRDPQYIPLFATWLRGERWEDEPPAPAKPKLQPWQQARVTQITEQLNKTDRVKQLMREGMSRDEAIKQVFG